MSGIYPDSYEIEPWIPAVSPGASGYGPAPKYVPYYAKSQDPRTMGQRIFGKRPTVSQGWSPASDFLPKSTKKMDMFRGIKPMRNPLFKGNGPWLDTGYLSKAKITPGDWITQDRALAKAYARGHSPTNRPAGPVLNKRIPIKDLFVPNEKLLNPGHGTRKPMFGPNPMDKVRYMPRGTQIDPNTGSRDGKLGLTGKEKHLNDLKKAKWSAGARKPMTIPGNVTGQMPRVRGIGGGLVNMFMEGPEMQRAKYEKGYGLNMPNSI